MGESPLKITVGVLVTLLVSVELDPPLFFFFLRLRDLELLALPISVSVFVVTKALLCIPTAGALLVWVVILSSVMLNSSYVVDSLI